MELNQDLYVQIRDLVCKGIAAGDLGSEGSSEERDAADANYFLNQGRLFAAARAVCGLLSSDEWDRLRELCVKAGQSSNSFDWDKKVVVTCEKVVTTENRW